MSEKIPLFKIYWDEEDIKAVTEVIKRGSYWATGPEIENFEKKIAEYVGVKYALAFNSGTSALHTLLLAHDVKDKEVIVPSFTFIATASAVVLAGGIPVFAESEAETFGLDAEDVERRITKKTKAIIALHYGGIPSRDIKKLKYIADKHNLLLIEDAAESIGSHINNKKVGTFGDSAIFSFCQNKVLSTGEGGMIITNSQEIYEKAKLMRSHGRVEEAEDYFSNIGDNDYIQAGFNFRMPSISAALGLSQLQKIQKIIDIRRENAHYFTKNLLKISEIKTPNEIEENYRVYQMYPLLLPDKKIRDALQNYLNEKGIMTKVYFNPIHLKTIFQSQYNYKKGDLPKTEALSNKILVLPLYPSIKKEEMEYIINSIKDFFAKDNKRSINKMLLDGNFSIKEAMNIIDRGGIKIAIVVDVNNKVLGYVTDEDIRKKILEGININRKISELINKDVVYVYDECPIKEINSKLPNANKGLGLPLLDGEGKIKDFILSSDGYNLFLFTEKPELKTRLNRILVIGGAGYIGSILVQELLSAGYKVTVLDNFLYGKESLEELKSNPTLKIIEGDTRHIEDIIKAIEDVDAVVHLAELVGDPACSLKPQITQEVNYLATKTVIEICKHFQINRFIYASSCSIYGSSDNNLLSETSTLNPISLYAEMKIATEKLLAEIKDMNFLPTILRFATAFGFSYRPRFDLFINLFTAQAFKENKITIFGGDQWRPNVHIKDIATTIIKILESPIEKVGGQTFNVGSEENNYTISEIGNLIKIIFPNLEINTEDKAIDKRNYKVDFSKLKDMLNIKMKYNVLDGIKEIKKAFEEGKIDDYKDKKYSNVKYLYEIYR